MNKTHEFKFNLPAYSDPVDVADLNDNFIVIDDALMAGLCRKEYTGNNMGSSDPASRKYAWAPWFEIQNDNEFEVTVTDRNVDPTLPQATITIAAGQSFRKYVNGTYYLNFYVQDQHDVTFKWFTDAETYINESGGGGGGTGTVTSVSVQGGSGSHLTGSGNPIETSGTITINVDEGYSIPSDDEQTAWDGKAADLKAEIDSSTYVLTLQLKDSSGNLIGNERTIDLPLETMVVDGEYDPQTKKIKLELKNGNYVEFSVADLVSGLQTELSASNKLDPTFIAYDSTHAAVTEAEKNTYAGKQNALTFDDTPTQNSNNPVKSGGVYTALSGKQDTISDLSTIRSGASAGETAVQPAELDDYVPNSSLVEVIDDGSKNKLQVESLSSTLSNGVSFTLNGDGTITAKRETTSSSNSTCVIKLNDAYNYVDDLCNGNYILSGCPSGGSSTTYELMATTASGVTYSYTKRDYGNGIELTDKDQATNIYVQLMVRSPFTGTVTFKPMICTKSQFGISQAYEPYALGNQYLTPELIELCDSGAKNVCKLDKKYISNNTSGTWSGDNLVVNGVTFAFDFNTGTVACSGTANADIFLVLNNDIMNYKGSNMAVSGCPSGGDYDNGYSLYVVNTSEATILKDVGSGNTFTVPDTVKRLKIGVRNGTNMSGKTFKPMICTAAAWNVSKKVVPYRPNWDLVSSKSYIFGAGTQIKGSSSVHENLNNYKTVGNYYCLNSEYTGYVDNVPITGSGFKLIVENVTDSTYRQTCYKPTDASRFWVRTFSNNAWGSWYVFTGEIVS